MDDTLIARPPLVVGITIPANSETDMDNCDLKTLVDNALRARSIDPDEVKMDYWWIHHKDGDDDDTNRDAINLLFVHSSETAASANFDTFGLGFGAGEKAEVPMAKSVAGKGTHFGGCKVRSASASTVAAAVAML